MSVGLRVQHAREYHGWTQTQLAKMVGVSQSAIHQIEKTGQVSDDTLAAIASATQFSLWWFSAGPLPDLPLGSLRFRKLASSRKRDDNRVRAHIRQSVEVFERLSPRVELPAVRVRPAAVDAVTNDSAIEQLALQAREWLGIGPSDPIPHLVRAVERAGIVVIGSAEEIERHSAVSFWQVQTEHPIICFSRGLPGDHQRFSVGHEVGHLVLHFLRTVDGKQAEAEANRFSGALLLPADIARTELEPPITLSGLAYVKARWGISVQALIRRCLDLQIISSDRRTSLEKQLSARGWRRAEPVHVPAEEPVLMSKILEATIGSTQRLHNALGLPPMAARDLVA